MQMAFKILKRVHRGELPFDRTVQVSVTDRLGKGADPRSDAAQSADAGSPAEAERSTTIAVATEQDDSQTAQSPRRLAATGPPPPPRRSAGRGTRPADPADRADDRHAGGVQPTRRRTAGRSDRPIAKADGRAAEREPLDAASTATSCRVTQETPTSLRNRVRVPEVASTPSTSRPSASSPKATCGWSSRSPRSIATAA